MGERLPKGGECRCRACGEMFSGVSVFDSHQVRDHDAGRVTCLPPASLGLVLDHRGTWSTPEGMARRDVDARRLRSHARSRSRSREMTASDGPGVPECGEEP